MKNQYYNEYQPSGKKLKQTIVFSLIYSPDTREALGNLSPIQFPKRHNLKQILSA